MQIVVNGDACDVPAGATVASVLQQLQLAARPVAVELNLEIVSRPEYPSRRLQTGDRVEIVTLVGGG
jgi:sulfur carrier protein